MKITMFSARNHKHSELKLNFKQVNILFSIIRPSYFGTHQGEKFFNRFIKDIREWLNVTDGKIGLFFNKEHIEVCHLDLVNEFSSRLLELKCTAEVFENGKFAQEIDLKSCEAFNLKSINQLETIMRHDIKKLTINVDRGHYLDEDEVALIPESEGYLLNTYVENVHLNCNELSLYEVTDLVYALLESCPSLKNFSIEMQESIKSYERFTAGRMSQHALSQRRKIMELKEWFAYYPFKPHIKLKIMFLDGDVDDYNSRWYENVEDQLVNLDCDFDNEFKSSGDERYHAIPGFHNRSSYLTFEDEECKLELDLIISIFGNISV